MPKLKQVVDSIEKRFSQRKKNRMWLSLSYLFRQLAGNLSFFYLPLFLFHQAQQLQWWGWDLNSIQKGMILIAAFYFTERFVSAIFCMIQAGFSIKVGHEWSMIVGTLSYMLFLVSFSNADKSPWFLLFGSLMAGVQLVFYWPSYNTLVARLSFKKNMGKNLGRFGFISNFTSMIAPAVGGLIILFLGYNYLFYVSIILLLFSLIGLFKLDLPEEKDEVNLKEYFEWMKEKRFVKLTASQSGRYFYDMSITLWPLYVFLLLGDVEKVGYVYSISLFIAMIINLFVGNFLDKKRKSNKPFYFSGGFLSTLSLLRLAVINVWGVVAVDACSRVVGNFHWLFNDSILFRRGKGTQEFSYFVYYAFNRAVAAALFWAVILFFFITIPVEWTGLFLMGALGALMSLLIREEKE